MTLAEGIMAERAIWKYTIPIGGEHIIEMPVGAKILHVDVQPAREGERMICLWAEVRSPDNQLPEAEKRSFEVFGTGHPLPTGEGLEYLGSFQLFDGGFVGHVYEDTGFKG